MFTTLVPSGTEFAVYDVWDTDDADYSKWVIYSFVIDILCPIDVLIVFISVDLRVQNTVRLEKSCWTKEADT